MIGLHDFAIPTLHGVGAARSLRLVVYCRGYQFALIDVPNLADPASRKVTIDLVPLGLVPLPGRTILPVGENASQFTLEVEYDASMLALGYFMRGIGNSGGSFPSSNTSVATAKVQSDGSFTVMVPDFLNDPAVAAMSSRGTLHFSAHGGRKSYLLVTEDSTGPMSRGLPIAKSYETGIVLQVLDRTARGR
jgi:hypothetical protein